MGGGGGLGRSSQRKCTVSVLQYMQHALSIACSNSAVLSERGKEEAEHGVGTSTVSPTQSTNAEKLNSLR